MIGYRAERVIEAELQVDSQDRNLEDVKEFLNQCKACMRLGLGTFERL
jgi:hypothetical protein